MVRRRARRGTRARSVGAVPRSVRQVVNIRVDPSGGKKEGSRYSYDKMQHVDRESGPNYGTSIPYYSDDPFQRERLAHERQMQYNQVALKEAQANRDEARTMAIIHAALPTVYHAGRAAWDYAHGNGRAVNHVVNNYIGERIGGGANDGGAGLARDNVGPRDDMHHGAPRNNAPPPPMGAGAVNGAAVAAQRAREARGPELANAGGREIDGWLAQNAALAHRGLRGWPPARH